MTNKPKSASVDRIITLGIDDCFSRELKDGEDYQFRLSIKYMCRLGDKPKAPQVPSDLLMIFGEAILTAVDAEKIPPRQKMIGVTRTVQQLLKRAGEKFGVDIHLSVEEFPEHKEPCEYYQACEADVSECEECICSKTNSGQEDDIDRLAKEMAGVVKLRKNQLN